MALVSFSPVVDECQDYHGTFVKPCEISPDEAPIVRWAEPRANLRHEKRCDYVQPAEIRFNVDSNYLAREMGPFRRRLRICLNLQNFRSRDTVEVVKNDLTPVTPQQITFQRYDDSSSGERVRRKLQDLAVHHRLAVLVLDAGGETALEIYLADPLQAAVRVEK